MTDCVIDTHKRCASRVYSEASLKNEQDRDEFGEKAFSSWWISYQDLSSLIEYCADVGERSLASERLTPLEYMLRRGHARACMLARETLLLLKNAYPDGELFMKSVLLWPSFQNMVRNVLLSI